jgi:hypothetical protein
MQTFLKIALCGLFALASTSVFAQATSSPTPQPAPSPRMGGMMRGGSPGAQGSQPGGMMGRGMMGMMDVMRSGMAGRGSAMGGRAHMMKIMFAIADADRDGGLSFEEMSAIHKRVSDAVDSDKNGKVTPEEIQAFMAN